MQIEHDDTGTPLLPVGTLFGDELQRLRAVPKDIYLVLISVFVQRVTQK
jgi:hypothetical protein